MKFPNLQNCKVFEEHGGNYACGRKPGCNKDICWKWDGCRARFGEPAPPDCPCRNCPKL